MKSNYQIRYGHGRPRTTTHPRKQARRLFAMQREQADRMISPHDRELKATQNKGWYNTHIRSGNL